MSVGLPTNRSTFWATRSGRVTRDGTGGAYISRTSVEEEDSGGLSPNQRVDQPTMVLAGRGRSKWANSTRSWLGGRTTSATDLSSKPYRTVTQHACHRLRRWLCQKHKVQGRACLTLSRTNTCTESLGLVQLRLCDRNVPWAKA